MNMRTFGLAAALGILVMPALALATDAPPQRRATMVVTGTITVDPQGAIANYTLHDSGRVPPSVLNLIKRTLAAWRFKPVVANGDPVTASTGMSLRIVADISDPQHATVRVGGASFGCAAGPARKLLPAACPEGASITYRHTTPPPYPSSAARSGVSGEVFLLVQVGPDGHVIHAEARQVNLYAIVADPAEGRQVLADAAQAAAKDWTFNVPTEGPAATAGKWVVTIPINFVMDAPVDAATGVRRRAPLWRVYIPGPIHSVPWYAPSASGTTGNTDAVAGDSPFMSDSRFVLLTQPRDPAHAPTTAHAAQG